MVRITSRQQLPQPAYIILLAWNIRKNVNLPAAQTQDRRFAKAQSQLVKRQPVAGPLVVQKICILDGLKDGRRKMGC